MNIAIILVELLTFIVGIVLGIFVFSRNPRNRISQIFAFTTLGMVGWNLTIFLLLAGIGPAYWPGKLSFAFGVLLSTGFIWFVFHFPTKMRWSRGLSIFFGVLGLIFFLIPVSPWWLSYVEVIDGMITGDLHPVLFPVWSLYYLFTYFFAFTVLTVRTLRAKGVDRKRLSQVLLGFALFLFPMLTTQLVLPLVFGDFRWNNLGPAFTIFLVAFLANAIINYRLMDIRWIVGKSLAFSVVSAVILWLVSTAVLFVSNLVAPEYSLMIAALLVALTFEPIVHFIDHLVSKVVNHGQYDSKKATEEVFEVVRTHGEIDSLIDELMARFVSYFSLTEVGIVAVSSQGKLVGSKFIGMDSTVEASVDKLARMAKSYKYEIVEAGELKWRGEYSSNAVQKKKDRDYLALMQKLGVEVMIPFVVEGRFSGMMLFGKRRYDRGLRSRDIVFLNLIKSGVAPAFENAAKLEEIKRLYEELAQLDKVKSEFISVVSHRFRTPLSAIRWNVENVLDASGKTLDADSKEALFDTQNRTLFLVRTLDSLFDTLALESGKLRLKKSTFNIKKASDELVGRYAQVCKNQGLSFSAKVSSLRLNADEKRILNVLDTLFSNACMYTQDGGVDVRIGKQGSSLVIQVQDSGIGIPKKDLDSIYDKFFRSKNAVLTYADGQGLGLYLAKNVVDMHKGSIDVDSEVGEGTTITIRLPLGKTK